jgi:hypothetical protein
MKLQGRTHGPEVKVIVLVPDERQFRDNLEKYAAAPMF